MEDRNHAVEMLLVKAVGTCIAVEKNQYNERTITTWHGTRHLREVDDSSNRAVDQAGINLDVLRQIYPATNHQRELAVKTTGVCSVSLEGSRLLTN